ncbi:MAG: FprA family A-type flavoprotein [bacterium]
MNTLLSRNVCWVGYVDWSVRDFHGYRTERGSTYNAYLVSGEKHALIDTVKEPHAGELLDHVRAHVPLEQVAYIVCNHAEPDHSGGLAQVLAACPQAAVVCNKKCAEALRLHFDTAGWTFRIVTDGEKLDLGGGRTLQFFDTPMVHWPESMATYLVEEQILFSMDAFGQHYAGPWRFDDEAPLDVVLAEAKTYYANIVMPYGRPVAAALAKLGALPLKLIAPSHGVIWRAHIARIVAEYQKWMVCRATRKVVILYTSMWNSTRVMARAIADGALDSEVDVRLIDLDTVHDTEVVTEVMDCACLAVGSPTLNQGIMPRMAATLTYLRGLKPVGKTGLVFGSYGWAARGSDELVQYLQSMQVTLLGEPMTCKFVPDPAMLQKCREAGRLLAQKAMEQ